jgi:hypothetical protein
MEVIHLVVANRTENSFNRPERYRTRVRAGERLEAFKPLTIAPRGPAPSGAPIHRLDRERYQTTQGRGAEVPHPPDQVNLVTTCVTSGSAIASADQGLRGVP